MGKLERQKLSSALSGMNVQYHHVDELFGVSDTTTDVTEMLGRSDRARAPIQFTAEVKNLASSLFLT